ncbi:Flp pilus assembly protein CpaB [Oceanobacillus damuensis]|uniref:Flp pilus assembly protein CpaB n=1 Tax=Oceanobacillus damuensis TaxID=937928 RepID=UPI0008300894|nr:Flp pilus assembly protein CpaB [Oceanobacillus damuensis]
MKPKKVLLLAILSGVITTFLFFMFINNQATETSATGPEIEMAEVVIAAADIPKDQQILQEQITVKEIPLEQIHPEMVKDINNVLHQYTITDIKQGEILMNHRMQKKEEEAEVISRKINEGYRAVSTEVTYVTGISNLIQPEDFVDVVLTSGENLETEMILEKVHVLAVGERMTEKKAEGAEPVLYQSVTLELNQEDTVKLINARAHGELHLALYSKSDLNEGIEEAEEIEEIETEEKASPTNGKVVTLPVESVIRKSPSLKADPIEIVKEETTLSLLGNQETDEDGRIWLEIETTDEQKGWISSRIIKGEQE